MGGTPRPVAGDPRSDAELAVAAAGDEAAFAVLYERHGRRVRGVCVRIAGAGADADDATQEAFLNLLTRLRAGGDPVESPVAYLMTTARHACLRILGRRGRVDLVDEPPERPAAGETPEPEARALTADLVRRVQAANARLPVRHREVLALREVGELPYVAVLAVADPFGAAIAPGGRAFAAMSSTPPAAPPCANPTPAASLHAAHAPVPAPQPAARPAAAAAAPVAVVPAAAPVAAAPVAPTAPLVPAPTQPAAPAPPVTPLAPSDSRPSKPSRPPAATTPAPDVAPPADLPATTPAPPTPAPPAEPAPPLCRDDRPVPGGLQDCPPGLEPGPAPPG